MMREKKHKFISLLVDLSGNFYFGNFKIYLESLLYIMGSKRELSFIWIIRVIKVCTFKLRLIWRVSVIIWGRFYWPAWFRSLFLKLTPFSLSSLRISKTSLGVESLKSLSVLRLAINHWIYIWNLILIGNLNVFVLLLVAS